VLDAEGIVKLSVGDERASELFEAARRHRGQVVTAATTLVEVLRGTARDAKIHRILSKITIVSIDAGHAKQAGLLLGQVGLSGHRCALDALLATVALEQPRPVILLTSDPNDMRKLTDEPNLPRRQRVRIVSI
jgi:predicted nucleic acid-binding protein